MTDLKKSSEHLPTPLKSVIKEMQTQSRDEKIRAGLILLDIITIMSKGSYKFAKLKGIASDLARDRATYTIKEQPANCGKKDCKKCPHGYNYYLYFRVQQMQNSRYLGRLGW